MPVRDDSYEVLTGRASGYGVYDPRNHYEWGGYAGGADNQRAGMWNQAQGAQQRQGPTIDQRQSDADFVNALQARQNQEYLQGYLGGVMTGQTATPAQQQLRAQTAQAQGLQRSAGASARGFGAVAGAPRDAMLRGQQIGLVGGQQMQVQRANDMASARDQYADLAAAMREQDLRSRGLQQQGAWDQAKLSDEQRAQNDAMARFYLNERYKVGGDQLAANEGYEHQQGANAAGESNVNWALLQQKDASDDRGTAAANKMTGDTLSVGTSMAGEDDDDDDDDRRRG